MLSGGVTSQVGQEQNNFEIKIQSLEHEIEKLEQQDPIGCMSERNGRYVKVQKDLSKLKRRTTHVVVI